MGKFILGYFVGYIASFITLAILQAGNKKNRRGTATKSQMRIKTPWKLLRKEGINNGKSEKSTNK